ncbi:MAG: 4-hydroxy-tetrahydrodipicolinate reductase, partial [Pygmaiobacter sp.]
IFDSKNIDALSSLDTAVDVAIDFSTPAVLPQVAAYVRRTHTPLLSGTTGYAEEQLADLHELGNAAAVLYSANYSLGVAVMARALGQMAAVLKEFDIEVVETHHNQKADAPSGTAKLLVDAVDPTHNLTPVYGREGYCGKRGKREIGVHAIRGGTVAGEHTVSFFGEDEVLEITHKAASRRIFANGALHAARALAALPHGFYTLQDILFGKEEPTWQ